MSTHPAAGAVLLHTADIMRMIASYLPTSDVRNLACVDCICFANVSSDLFRTVIWAVAAGINHASDRGSFYAQCVHHIMVDGPLPPPSPAKLITPAVLPSLAPFTALARLTQTGGPGYLRLTVDLARRRVEPLVVVHAREAVGAPALPEWEGWEINWLIRIKAQANSHEVVRKQAMNVRRSVEKWGHVDELVLDHDATLAELGDLLTDHEDHSDVRQAPYPLADGDLPAAADVTKPTPLAVSVLRNTSSAAFTLADLQAFVDAHGAGLVELTLVSRDHLNEMRAHSLPSNQLCGVVDLVACRPRLKRIAIPLLWPDQYSPQVAALDDFQGPYPDRAWPRIGTLDEVTLVLGAPAGARLRSIPWYALARSLACLGSPRCAYRVIVSRYGLYKRAEGCEAKLCKSGEAVGTDNDFELGMIGWDLGALVRFIQNMTTRQFALFTATSHWTRGYDMAASLRDARFNERGRCSGYHTVNYLYLNKVEDHDDNIEPDHLQLYCQSRHAPRRVNLRPGPHHGFPDPAATLDDMADWPEFRVTARIDVNFETTSQAGDAEWPVTPDHPGFDIASVKQGPRLNSATLLDVLQRRAALRKPDIPDLDLTVQNVDQVAASYAFRGAVSALTIARAFTVNDLPRLVAVMRVSLPALRRVEFEARVDRASPITSGFDDIGTLRAGRPSSVNVHMMPLSANHAEHPLALRRWRDAQIAVARLLANIGSASIYEALDTVPRLARFLKTQSAEQDAHLRSTGCDALNIVAARDLLDNKPPHK
ncbi:hypothetical protein Q5752_003961 [Cryptotrichosporon argae]